MIIRFMNYETGTLIVVDFDNKVFEKVKGSCADRRFFDKDIVSTFAMKISSWVLNDLLCCLEKEGFYEITSMSLGKRLTPKGAVRCRAVGEEKLNKWYHKLSFFEDIEERIKCPFSLIEEVAKTWKIYSTWKHDYMRVENIILWEHGTRPYMRCYWTDTNGKEHLRTIYISQYQETWRLEK